MYIVHCAINICSSRRTPSSNGDHRDYESIDDIHLVVKDPHLDDHHDHDDHNDVDDEDDVGFVHDDHDDVDDEDDGTEMCGTLGTS